MSNSTLLPAPAAKALLIAVALSVLPVGSALNGGLVTSRPVHAACRRLLRGVSAAAHIELASSRTTANARAQCSHNTVARPPADIGSAEVIHKDCPPNCWATSTTEYSSRTTDSTPCGTGKGAVLSQRMQLILPGNLIFLAGRTLVSNPFHEKVAAQYLTTPPMTQPGCGKSGTGNVALLTRSR